MQSPAPGVWPTSRVRISALVLALATLVLFWPATRFDYVAFDDPLYVTENPWVRSGVTSASLVWIWNLGYAGLWAPLTWASYLLDVSIFGLAPGPIHRTNVVLHALNAALLFAALAALGRSLAERGASSPARVLLAAGGIASLFAFHPQRVESVAWIAERKGLLCAGFVFVCLLGYVRYVRRPSLGGYLAVTAALAAALAAKPSAVIVPLWLLLLDAWPLGRLSSGEWRARVVEKAPWFLIALAVGILSGIAQARGGAVMPISRWGLADRAATAVIGGLNSIAQAIWPARLAAVYPLPLEGWPLGQAAVAAGTIVLSTLIALRRGRAQPWLAVGWFAFLVAWLPVGGLAQVGLHAWADRHTYLAHLGLYLIVVMVVGRGAAVLPRVVVRLAAVTLLAALALATRHQLEFWRDGSSLFERAIAVTRENHVAHLSLAIEYERRGRLEEALRQGQEALRLRPDDASAHDQVGSTLARLGRTAEALERFRRAIELDPSLAWAQFDLGSLLLQSGRADEASAALSRAVQIDPWLAEGWGNLGLALRALGRPDEAIAATREALRIKPGLDESRMTLGSMLADRGQLADARVELERVAAERGHDARSVLLLASVELELGNLEEVGRWLDLLRAKSPEDAARLERAIAVAGYGAATPLRPSMAMQ